MGTIERGFETPPLLHADLKRLQRTSLTHHIAVAIGDHAVIAACGVAGVLIWRSAPVPIALVSYVFLAAVCARQLRALECLEHDASHHNWTRSSRRLNDGLADVLASWAVLSRVKDYRRTHQVHHNQLGSESDADLIRWNQLSLDQLRRDAVGPFVVGIAGRLVRYTFGWWWANGVGAATVLRSVAWHATVIAVATVLTSPGTALFWWVLAYGIPIFVTLPMLRFIAEIEEHRYGNVTSVLEATYTNVGVIQRLVLHPHGDAYHSFHHLYPAVPGFRAREAHFALVEIDPEGYGVRVPIRRAVVADCWV